MAIIPTPAPGDSSEQREAEAVMIATLAREMGVELSPQRVDLPDGSYVNVDGASDDLSVLCEAWAHQGPPKSAQKMKVAVDAFKISHVARSLGTSPRLVLVFCDEHACKRFRGSGWLAGAIRSHGIEIKVVDIPDDLRDRLRQAQHRQFR